ncbi:hypothetical protein MFIFM68171_02715 [Madurella fahalii]|uniref:Uncharacterized protein n=1 Tax=Madurella fahalii TaxID=1157608 RepID=A0ABQ0G432_9PEZI
MSITARDDPAPAADDSMGSDGVVRRELCKLGTQSAECRDEHSARDVAGHGHGGAASGGLSAGGGLSMAAGVVAFGAALIML